MEGIDDLPPELDQLVARDLHDKGKEFTPDQVHDIGRSAFAKIRAAMRDCGYEMPHSDTKMLEYMQELMADRKHSESEHGIPRLD